MPFPVCISNSLMNLLSKTGGLGGKSSISDSAGDAFAAVPESGVYLTGVLGLIGTLKEASLSLAIIAGDGERLPVLPCIDVADPEAGPALSLLRSLLNLDSRGEGTSSSTLLLLLPLLEMCNGDSVAI